MNTSNLLLFYYGNCKVPEYIYLEKNYVHLQKRFQSNFEIFIWVHYLCVGTHSMLFYGMWKCAFMIFMLYYMYFVITSFLFFLQL